MITWTALLAALTAGVMGSVHCGAMCGGIASALAANGRGKYHALLNNIGRIGSYSIAGAVAGGIGGGFGVLLGLQDWALGLRVATGVVLILVGLQLLGGGRFLRPVEKLGAGIWHRLAPFTRRVAADRSARGALLFGAVWGWMPCGLVYSMLLAAAATGDYLQGALLMAVFGLGTTPGLLALAIGGQSLRNHHTAIRRFGGAVVLLFGVWTASAPFVFISFSDGLHCHLVL